ncbi:E3 ubiquitin-protein ligase RNF12-B-like [Macrobrachium rosenbergii]|uniref:E3 ubiquitin-protein ligase RNF12-B-like n=1 Tax=Macrobrachium rosenbergii TaxID=79674 RepID=UPI0034D72900
MPNGQNALIIISKYATLALAVTDPTTLGPPAQESHECNVQWPPPSRSILDPIPVPGPDPVPVPGPQIDTRLGDPTLDSQSLPVSLGTLSNAQALSVPNDEQIPNQLLVPGPALVPVPEHVPNLHSRDPSPGSLSSPSLAPLPMPIRETDRPDHSGSSPKGAGLQPVPELVTLTCEPLTPPRPFPLCLSPLQT